MKKRDWIIGKLLEYFYAIEMYDKKNNELDDVMYSLVGVHAISTDSIHVTPESRDSKLVNYSEKIIPIENEIEKYKKLYENLYKVLCLEKLDRCEYLILEYIYRYKKKYDDIARLIGYANKTVVYRKRNKILDNIEKYDKEKVD